MSELKTCMGTSSLPPQDGDNPCPPGSGLPPTGVLRCPECSFMGTSTNQMCRHIFMTEHCLAKCAECDMRLLTFPYCAGVVKLLNRAKKDGMLFLGLAMTPIETPERHASRTQHSGIRGATLWTKKDFEVTGTPSDYGLTSGLRCHQSKLPDHLEGRKFQCPECLLVISTWTQMTKHLETTNHSLARCAECGMPLKCYGANQPAKHQRCTGHRGFIGYFRVKEDYVFDPTSEEGSPAGKGNFQVSCPECGVTFFHTCFLTEHMRQSHKLHLQETTEQHPVCSDCDYSAPVEEMELHLRATGHSGILPDTSSHLALQCVVARPPRKALCSRRKCPEDASSTVLPSNGFKVMHQCPECLAIFSSWTKMEKHILYTKHSLPKCAQCGLSLPLRGPNCPEDHLAITGHKGLVGEVRGRKEYEVTVDTMDADLRELIDDRSMLPLRLKPPYAEDDAHLVFQCPIDSCLHVCLSWVQLEKHFSETLHAFLTCAICGATCAPWKPHVLSEHKALKGHAFASTDEQPPKTVVEEYQVKITSSELLTYYGNCFKQCSECAHVLEASMMSAHVGSRRCRRDRERRCQQGRSERALASHSRHKTTSNVVQKPPAAPQPIGVPTSEFPSDHDADQSKVAPTEMPLVLRLLALLQLPAPSVYHSDPVYLIAAENSEKVSEVHTALLLFMQSSLNRSSAVLRVMQLLEPLSRAMHPSIIPFLKNIIVTHHPQLPWESRLLDCMQCIIHVSRVFDPLMDRLTIIMLQQYLNERFAQHQRVMQSVVYPLDSRPLALGNQSVMFPWSPVIGEFSSLNSIAL